MCSTCDVGAECARVHCRSCIDVGARACARVCVCRMCVVDAVWAVSVRTRVAAVPMRVCGSVLRVVCAVVCVCCCHVVLVGALVSWL